MMSNEKNITDVGNRGVIEVKGGRATNKIFAIIAVIIGVTIIIGFVLKMFFYQAEKPKDAVIEKDSNAEALNTDMSNGDTLASFMKDIKDREDREREEEKQKSDESKNKADSSSKVIVDKSKDNTVRVISDKNENDGYQSSQPGQDKNVPLPKSQRVLTGNTLVEFDNKEAANQNTENPDELQGESYADGYAYRIKNRDFLLSAGSSLSCVLKTKIITSYPGITLCQLTKDIYSDNGKTLLVRAGAMLTGKQSKAMVQGVARVFVNWSSISDGNIRVRIDALGTDGLGASGLPAWIDTHFSDRFGGAMMLSMIGDTMDSLKNLTQKTDNNNGSITYDNSSNAIQEMAKTTLQNTINIPPTAYVNQGELLSVLVPRNIDFSSVYGVH